MIFIVQDVLYIVGVGCGHLLVANVARRWLVGSARVLPRIDSSG